MKSSVVLGQRKSRLRLVLEEMEIDPLVRKEVIVRLPGFVCEEFAKELEAMRKRDEDYFAAHCDGG